MSKQRNIRKRRAVDDDDEIPHGAEDEDTQKPLTAEEIRFLQKQRQRKTVSIIHVPAIPLSPLYFSNFTINLIIWRHLHRRLNNTF